MMKFSSPASLEIVILMKFSSPAASGVATFGAASVENNVKITFPFQGTNKMLL